MEHTTMIVVIVLVVFVIIIAIVIFLILRKKGDVKLPSYIDKVIPGGEDVKISIYATVQGVKVWFNHVPYLFSVKAYGFDNENKGASNKENFFSATKKDGVYYLPVDKVSMSKGLFIILDYGNDKNSTSIKFDSTTSSDSNNSDYKLYIQPAISKGSTSMFYLATADGIATENGSKSPSKTFYEFANPVVTESS